MRPKPVTHKAWVINHLQSSSGAVQSETLFLFLFISLLSLSLFLLQHLFLSSSLFIHSILCVTPFPPVVSLNETLYRLTWLSSLLPSPFLSPLCNLPALSLTSDSDSHLPDCHWSMLSIHASSPAERDRWSHSSSNCSWAMNSPHKHWHKPEANAALQTSHKFSCKPTFNYFSTGRKKFLLT